MPPLRGSLPARPGGHETDGNMRENLSREAYRQAWADAFTSDPAVPLNLDLELASVCNLSCPFCFWGEGAFQEAMKQPAADGKAKKRLMPAGMALRLINQAAVMGIPALKFNWRGESTIHPNYSKILTHARQLPFHDLLVNTNANCKDAALDGLMAATKVMVSLDSTVPETYAVMRAGGSLDRAIEVTRELVRRGHPNLWVRRVVTKENRGEPFARTARELFGPAVHISEHACIDRNTKSRHQADNPDAYERAYCGYPSQRIVIASDGTAYPCCIDTDASMPVGNVDRQTLPEIWSGKPMKELRARLRRNVFESAICQKCESWMAYKAPQRDLVQDKEIHA
jgi:radical SAM protein with 4Fe4S-binding SPASM domain